MTIVAVSLKMYFERARTLRYCEEVARIAASVPATAELQMAVYTDFLTVPAVAQRLAGASVLLGAQDLAPEDRGALTGEVSGADLADLGVRTVEVGHYERRTVFGEDEQMVAAKTRAALRNGMVPMLCVGEPEQTDPAKAAEACLAHVRSAVGQAGTDAPLWVGYEPYWAIGAPQPAPVGYVQEVCQALRAGLTELAPTASVVYGGSAGPGLLTELVPAVDGVFLGRFAHDPAALEQVVAEALAVQP
ncbi:triose-phosphate isomerase family protein [Actinomyces faecalis]|uniref:triose-phosphate isomerase family protein n=1 Tax=Actinomyces faecalis TaxID=2722820 RepID=UPI001C12D41C|nr:triose-phosphate isomerase family protein [Actinomyces faecalis]